MIRRAFQSFLIVVAVMAMVFACSRKGATGKSSETTQTIAPAAAQTSPTDTDAMTETVEIQEDSRSEAEGGVLTSPKPPVKPPATTTTVKKKTTRSTKSRPSGSTQ